jgi:hypothetical protein
MTALLLAALLLPPLPAPQPQPDLSLMFLPSVQYGAPMRISAGVSVFIPTAASGGFRRDGYIVEAAAGQSGARLSLGRVGYLEYFGLDARAVFSRTWGSPLRASTDSTYAGVEGGMTIAYVRVSIGVAQRLSGASGQHGTTVTWSAGVHYPLHAK